MSLPERSKLVHDIRSEMQKVLGFLELLCAEGGDPLTPKQQRYAENARRSGANIMDIIVQFEKQREDNTANK